MLERTSCGDNAVLHVISVHAVFPQSNCTETWKHVDGAYFRMVKSECEQNNCVNLTTRDYWTRCNNQTVRSIGVTIVYRCNILPDEETTTAFVSTSVLTTPSETTAVEANAKASRTPTSPLDVSSIAANKIGLYAGVSVAAVVLVTIIAVALVRRKRTQVRNADVEISDEYLHMGHPNTSNVRSVTHDVPSYDNVVSRGASDTPVIAHDDVAYEDVTPHPNSDVALYDNISDQTNDGDKASDNLGYDDVRTRVTTDQTPVWEAIMNLPPDLRSSVRQNTPLLNCSLNIVLKAFFLSSIIMQCSWFSKVSDNLK